MSKKVLALAVLAAVVITGAWYMLLWRPQSAALIEARDRVDAAEQQANVLSIKVTKLRRLKKSEAAQLATLERLEAGVPAAPDLEGFLVQLNSAADSANTTVVNMAATPPTGGAAPQADISAALRTPSNLTAVPITLTVTADYADLLEFITALQEMDRLVVIDGLNATATENSTQLNVQVSARIFTTAKIAAPVEATAPADEAGTL